jgi:hypothetical protein
VPKLFNLFAILVIFASLPCQAAEIRPAGRRLAERFDGMDVEHLWLPGQLVDWRTGKPFTEPPTSNLPHTHCSAFVAEACRRLGIYLLRPPEHSTVLLSNAQYDWLFQSGRDYGWLQFPDGQWAQRLANEGFLVVAVCKASDPKYPGHIAIIRPSTKSSQMIDGEGPQIVQVGIYNVLSTSLKDGFRDHPDAWGKQKVRYFAHKVETDVASR